MEISLSYLFELFLRRIFILLSAGVIFAAAAFSYCNWVAQPVYSAKTQIIVSNGALIMKSENNVVTNSNGADNILGSDIQASSYLANVCVSLLETQDLYKQLADNFDNKYTYQQLRSVFTVSLKKQDDIFINVSSKASSAEEAKQLANAFIMLAPQYLENYIPGTMAKVTETADRATLVYPLTVTTTATFFIIGIAVAYIISLIVDLSDRSIKGIENFVESYDIAVLGCVPNFEEKTNEGGYENA